MAKPKEQTEPTPESMMSDWMRHHQIWTRVDADGKRTRVDPSEVYLTDDGVVDSPPAAGQSPSIR